ncbi:glycosyltransferase family 4 protein [Pedobacter sp. MC2016-14]|uniref:glycosyltransferase family 4 protein n=1 Tax=Pedobacter sp. MC2016-14 TaxID=2897327 RepID=UPI001E311DF0|nr:glycosyltransferase family 1 protein [Pedobacter sp. MC2016-14]MCD0486957.1 glycosyltransferase family 4 protein [Pedobacter sp. MC2016-14]
MKQTIYLNGRFTTQALTGVQRTAYELVKGLDKMLENGEIDKDKFCYRLIYSGEMVTPIALKHIDIVKKGVLKGNLWEQLELPLYTFGNLLISMCSVSTLFKRKQLLMVHDASFMVNPRFFPFIFRTWYKLAIPLLSKIAQRLVTVSAFSKQQLVKFAGFEENKLEIIYNAADHLSRFQEPDEDFKTKISALKPFVLAVSSLSVNKNFPVIGEAIEKIDFKPYQMLIAGGASATLQQSAPSSFVKYLGYVSNAELKYLYQNASLFIFPSLYEGFGIPPLEAMYSGCPVISSNTSSLPEVLGDACVYFNPNDAQDLANQLQRLLKDEIMLELLRKKGLQRAKLYSWQQSARKLHALIITLN